MSNISQTYSGDFTSFIAGKLLNAAGMAKGESDRRETKNLEKARPGSLYFRALQSEFGGDLYNRTLGNFDPRKSAKETDRKSSKESRYTAQFPTKDKERNSSISDAERELLKDDDSIPVKDVDKRESISKFLGAGLDARLIRSEARTTALSRGVAEVNSNLFDAQKLIFDQTELLSSKFDTMLEIFSQQREFQKRISDEGQVKRREDELEQEKDLATTRKIQSLGTGKRKGDLLGKLLGTAADLFRGRGSELLKNLLGTLKNKKGSSFGSLLRGLGKATAESEPVTQFLQNKRYFGKAFEGIKKKYTKKGRGITASQKLKIERRNKLAAALGVNPTRLADELRMGGLAALNDMYEMGMLDPSEFKEAKDAAHKIMRESVLEGFPPPSKGDDLMKEIIEDRKSFVERRGGKGFKLENFQSKSPIKKKASSAMGKKVSEKLSTKAGATALSKSGQTAATKALGKSGKFVPGIGTAISLTEAAYRFANKDPVGGVLSTLSAIPVFGWGFTALDIARDLGFDPLNTLPENRQYEAGTELAKKGPAVLHGTELILRQKDRQDMLGSFDKSIENLGSHLVSTSLSIARDAGVEQEVKSNFKSNNVDYDIISLPFKSKVKKGRNASLVSISNDMFNGVEDAESQLSFSSKDLSSGARPQDPVDPPEEDPDPNTVVPEYDLDFNEPNSAVKMTSGNTVTYYKTDANGALGAEITEAEAKRIIARKSRPVSPSNPGRNGSYASGTKIGRAGDNDGEQTGLNMNLPGGIGTPIYAPVDLIYRSKGTDGNPAVGLQGTPDALGPSGSGFGYYGAYYFEKDGREYEVLMGHFRDLPFKGSSEGEVIPKGTLIGYQGASGRSDPQDGTNNPYPHISLHVNAVDVSKGIAGNDVLRWFAEGLAGGNISTGNGGGGGGYRKLSLARDGAAIQRVGNDVEFLKELTRISKKFNISEGDLLGLIASESSLDPQSNNGEYVGLIQFSKDSAKMVGTTQAALLQMTRAEQMKYVEKYLEWWGLPRGADAGQLYSVVFAPALASGDPNTVMYRQGSGAYKANRWLDTNQDGVITVSELGGRIQRKKGEYGISNLAGPKIVGPGKVGPGKVGSGIPFFPDLTIKKFVDAIQKGINDGLDDSRETFDKGLIPTRNNRANQLQSNSSLMEDMEEDSMVQQVYIVNNVLASSPITPPVITSRGGDNSNYVDQYRMAVLGA